MTKVFVEQPQLHRSVNHTETGNKILSFFFSKKIKIKKKNMCPVSHIMCCNSDGTCCVSPVFCHQLLKPRATAKEPLSSNSPTMHNRLVCVDSKNLKLNQLKIIKTFEKNTIQVANISNIYALRQKKVSSLPGSRFSSRGQHTTNGRCNLQTEQSQESDAVKIGSLVLGLEADLRPPTFLL